MELYLLQSPGEVTGDTRHRAIDDVTGGAHPTELLYGITEDFSYSPSREQQMDTLLPPSRK